MYVHKYRHMCKTRYIQPSQSFEKEECDMSELLERGTEIKYQRNVCPRIRAVRCLLQTFQETLWATGSRCKTLKRSLLRKSHAGNVLEVF